MSDSSRKYRSRRMSNEERVRVLEERRRLGVHWHGPPHPEAPGEYRIVTTACFKHRRILSTPERVTWFESERSDGSIQPRVPDLLPVLVEG